jgi:hypothetical protein
MGLCSPRYKDPLFYGRVHRTGQHSDPFWGKMGRGVTSTCHFPLGSSILAILTLYYTIGALA